MKVLMKGVTPDGVRIQIEDWNMDYSFRRHGDIIAAFPKIREKEERVQFNTDSCLAAFTLFEMLRSGEVKLEECAFDGMRCARPIPLKVLLKG